MQILTDGVSIEHSSERDAEISAIHEAGHALVYLYNDVPIAKVSNIPYSSGVGGITQADLDIIGEQQFKFKKDYIREISMLLGGKCAEDIKYGEHTQGCSNDIKVATEKIYNMVTNCAYEDDRISNENTLIEAGVLKSILPETKETCDRLLKEYNEMTMELLIKHKDELFKLAKMIQEQRTVVQPTLESIREYK